MVDELFAFVGLNGIKLGDDLANKLDVLVGSRNEKRVGSCVNGQRKLLALVIDGGDCEITED